MPVSASHLPIAAALVLRDRTNSISQQVLVCAIEDLVSAGVWQRRGALRFPGRRVMLLWPVAGTAPDDLVEPLRTVDAVLRRVAAAHDDRPFEVRAAARWMALNAKGVPTEVVKGTIEDLVARGLLECAPRAERPDVVDLRPTAAGAAALAACSPPAPAALASHDPDRRREAVDALPKPAAAFLLAWAATVTGGGGFPAGTVGSAFDGSGHAIASPFDVGSLAAGAACGDGGGHGGQGC